MPEAYWLGDPLLPEDAPPADAEVVWRVEQAGELWTATPVLLQESGRRLPSRGWLLAWARRAGDREWGWCLVAWQDVWDLKDPPPRQEGGQVYRWRTGWARYDAETVRPSDWPEGRGAWSRFAGEHLDRVIERARAGEIGWIDTV